MTKGCTVRLLGIGAVSLRIDASTYYIDAFNDYNEPPNLSENDVILFTHDDKDHFSTVKLAKSLKASNVIIGPPSIGLPLITEASARKEQIHLNYPVEGDSPISFKNGPVIVKTFRTAHFLDWHAIHVSYLLEIGNLKIYITGDSDLSQIQKTYLEGIDVSLLNSDIAKGKIPNKYGTLFAIVDLLKIQYEYQPRMIVGNHLINCNWAVNPKELNEMVKEQELSNIEIPYRAEDEVYIKENV